MGDIEITQLCAEALGYSVMPHSNRKSSKDLIWIPNGGNWNPLTNDAQAMALVKRLNIAIQPYETNDDSIEYQASIQHESGDYMVSSADLNRAICKCVANMQSGK